MDDIIFDIEGLGLTLKATYGRLLNFEPENFKHFDILQHVDIIRNGIFDLPHWIKQCVNLKSLYLDYNPITDIEIEDLPKELVELSLSNTGLSMFPIVPKTILTLTLMNNHIAIYEDPELIPQLKHLNLRNNDLEILPNRLSKTLKFLDVSNNHLVRLPRNLPNLICHANFSGNKLRGLPARLPSRLTFLDLSNNELTTVNDIKFPEQLKHLYLNNNKLRRINFILPPNILTLYLNNNKISGSPVLELPDSLQILYLQENLIESIKSISFSRLSTLASLNISNNPIKQLDALPINLFELYCRNCKLTGELNILPDSLESLHCENNNISLLQDSLPLNLSNLCASGNNLKTISKIPKKLQTLKLSNNKLIILPELLDCADLKILHVENNLLKELPDHFPNKIVEIVASNNQIIHIPNILPESLLIFKIRQNKLQIIKNSIKTCQNLRIFTFSENPIIFVNADVRRFLRILEQNPFPLIWPNGELLFAEIDNLPNALVYEDPESVHRTGVRGSIWTSINNISMNIPLCLCLSEDDVISEMMADQILTFHTKNIICNHMILNGGSSISEIKDMTIFGLFRRIWYIISQNEHKISIKEILNGDLEEPVCYVGFIGRITSCLVSYVDYIKINISETDQYSNIIIRTKLNLGDKYTLESHKAFVQKEMEERQATPRTISTWLDAITE